MASLAIPPEMEVPGRAWSFLLPLLKMTDQPELAEMRDWVRSAGWPAQKCLIITPCGERAS